VGKEDACDQAAEWVLCASWLVRVIHHPQLGLGSGVDLWDMWAAPQMQSGEKLLKFSRQSMWDVGYARAGRAWGGRTGW
jgi:hypothetical protein